MEVKRGRGSDIKWKSLCPNGSEWFSGTCSLFDLKFEKFSDKEIAEKLSLILYEACRLNSDFLSQWYGFKVTTQLEFDRNWGLGSSSSLVYCIAQWADVEPYELYDRTFGGSGYDIACAKSDSPLLYTRKEEEIKINYVDFDPEFKNQLYFVYLGQKKNSAEALTYFEKFKSKVSNGIIDEVSLFSRSIANAQSLEEFCNLLNESENLIEKELKLSRIQKEKFNDFEGTVKSLGAWGGDFVLAASALPDQYVTKYFNDLGLNTVIPYSELANSKKQVQFA
nr:hypothetical protein [Saprospiraceae bacterium]